MPFQILSATMFREVQPQSSRVCQPYIKIQSEAANYLKQNMHLLGLGALENPIGWENPFPKSFPLRAKLKSRGTLTKSTALDLRSFSGRKKVTGTRTRLNQDSKQQTLVPVLISRF